MTTFSERLRDARNAAGLTQEGLAKAIGHKTQSVIASLENGQNKSSSYIPEIAKALRVDAYWLKTGKGERSLSGLSATEQRIIAGYRLMGPEGKAMWLMTADAKIAEAAAQSKAA